MLIIMVPEAKETTARTINMISIINIIVPTLHLQKINTILN